MEYTVKKASDNEEEWADFFPGSTKEEIINDNMNDTTISMEGKSMNKNNEEFTAVLSEDIYYRTEDYDNVVQQLQRVEPLIEPLMDTDLTVVMDILVFDKYLKIISHTAEEQGFEEFGDDRITDWVLDVCNQIMKSNPEANSFSINIRILNEAGLPICLQFREEDGGYMSYGDEDFLYGEVNSSKKEDYLKMMLQRISQVAVGEGFWEYVNIGARNPNSFEDR